MSTGKSRPGLWLLPAIALLIAVGAPAMASAGDSRVHPRQFGATATPASVASPTRTSTQSTATPRSSAPVELALPTPTPTAIRPAPTLTVTEIITISLPLTETLPATETLALTGSSPLTGTAALTESAPVVLGAGVTVTLSAGPSQGTVVVNRTNALVRYFVEGETRELEPLRSVGFAVERPTAVLNLYNCDAALADTQGACFWDPYLLTRDGFYEIVSGRDAGAVVSLVLREAGGPPAGEVWIQNRTAGDEEVYFGTQMYSLPVAALAEFPVESGGVGVFYLRTCVEGATGTGSAESSAVCEWSAHTAEPGAYYAIVAESWAGSVAGTTITSLALQPVLGAAEAEGTPVATPDSAQMLCRLAVPALNVRSGPGLGFEIVRKVRTSGVDVATIVVVARTSDTQWLKVDERVATGGWVISGDEYLTCDGDVNALPVVAESELPATPVPTPAPIVAQPEPAPAVEPSSDEASADDQPAEGEGDGAGEGAPVEEPVAQGIPAGQGLLVVNNGFDQTIRFTLDQIFRVEPGASEVDLAPGQSATFVVFPGTIRFSVSSPWRALAGNAEFVLEPDTQRSLWIAFIPDEGEPGNFILTY